MSLEHLNRISNEEQPFKYLMRDVVHEWEKRDQEMKLQYLKTLDLGTESTAEDVRRVAISLRLKFHENGLNEPTFSALWWALKKTKDAVTSDEFLHFLTHPKATFGGIETNRWDFR